MGSNKKADNKRARREHAIKQEKKKKIIIISIVSVIVLSLAAFFIINALSSSGTVVFSDGSQTVSFRDNGNFTASLSHSVVYSGSYTFDEQAGGTSVSFTMNGFTVTSEIVDEQLILPVEWHDACGHNFILPKK